MNSLIPRILVVDDESWVRGFLGEALRGICQEICVAADFRQALACSGTHSHDVILADICLHGCSGIELLQLAHDLEWESAVILMTGHATTEEIALGARYQPSDFLLKPFGIDALKQAVQRAYSTLLKHRLRRHAQKTLGSDLLRRNKQLEVARQDLRNSYRSVLESLIATLEAREPNTYAHSFRVRAYAMHLAQLMDYPSASLPQLAYAALLHDIGKIAVSDAILLKPGKLKAEEFETMKQHSVIGERIVAHVRFLDEGAVVIRHHHESWDGSGYPDGLCGLDIPLGSRLFAVADTLDAMTSDRCYRPALKLSDARAEITRCSGTQFDPEVVRAATGIANEEWMQLREQADKDAEVVRLPDFSPVAAPFFLPELLQPRPVTV